MTAPTCTYVTTCKAAAGHGDQHAGDLRGRALAPAAVPCGQLIACTRNPDHTKLRHHHSRTQVFHGGWRRVT